jgi:DNA polymerase-3 subunit alpha
MEFTSLHHHSTFSYLDGYGTPEQHVQAAADIGMDAVALTEHGNVSSHVRLERACDEAGMKAIFGCELYTGGVDEATKSRFKWHLTVLAENQEGYKNLLRLVSKGWAEGFYYEPTVSGEMLAEHAEGLIVLSGCSGSKMACDLLGGKGVDPHDADLRAARRTAERFKTLLGDRFYLEAQAFPELERTRNINTAWHELSRSTGIPLVVTGDVHYPKPEDNEMQLVLHAVGRGGQNNTVEKQAQGWGYDIKLTMLRDEAILKRLVATGIPKTAAMRALRTSKEVAARCNVRLPKLEPLRYPAGPQGSEALFRTWLRKGWEYRGIDSLSRKQRRRYVERVKYEIDLIVQKDFVDYFLMLSDVVRFAKNRGIPVGPARGSAAASLVCYLLRITEVDPMHFPNLLFERFIDINRHDLPDVDLDFDDERRHEIRAYLVEQWGAERVGNIGTFTRYKGKNSIDDVARVYSIPEYETKALKELLIERASGDLRGDATIQDTIEMFPQAREMFEKYPDLFKAERLEGNLRGFSVHAAGLVVANSPLTDAVAVYTREDKKNGTKSEVVSIDKHDADYLNVLKIDVLGLATMGMIRLALEEIGMSLDALYKIPLDDPETLCGFQENDVVGVFQFDGRAMRSVNQELKPDNFAEVCDVNALARPGPLHSGAAADYIMAKHGKKPAVHYPAPAGPILDEITLHTNYQIVYQEQILQAVRRLADFTWEESSRIRKLISKKQGEQALNAMQARFMDGTAANGIDEGTAAAIWKSIVTAGAYAFNAAHCVTGDTVLRLPGHRKDITIGHLYDCLTKFVPGKSGKGNGYLGPCACCGGNNDSQRWGRQCAQCYRWRRAYNAGKLRGLSVGSDRRVRPNKIEHVFDNGVQPIYEITTDMGTTIRVTGDHCLLTMEWTWRRAEDFVEGEVLRMSNSNIGNPWVKRSGPNYWRMRNVREKKCRECGQIDGLIDVAHLDQDHTNDAEENLAHLCRACHSAYDAAKPPWSKGFGTHLEQIVSIKEREPERVYTLQMSAEGGHNYVTEGGFISRNCVSYGMLAFWTMWLKRHHPQAFYAAALRKVSDNKAGEAKRGQLLRDAAKKGIAIMPPDVRHSAVTWRSDHGGIRAGLLQVKGVGEKAAEGLVWLRDNVYGGDAATFTEDNVAALRDAYKEKRGEPRAPFTTGTLAALDASALLKDPFELNVLTDTIGKVRQQIINGELGLLPTPTHTSQEVPYEARFERVVWLGVVRERNLKDLFELHMSRTGEQLDPATVKDPHLVNWTVLLGEDDTDILTITIDRWKYPKFKEAIWGLRPGKDLLLVKGVKKRQYRRAIYVDSLWVIDPEED